MIGAKTHTFWTNLATWFTQLLPKQNTDFVHFIYWTNILNWPLNLALLHGKKELPFKSTDRAHWSNGIDERSKCKHATIRQHWQRSDPMGYRHVRLTVLQPNDAGDPVSGSHISGLSQPCYNVVPVHALIGAPSAGGALGHA